MATIAFTGSAGGMGQATRRRLEDAGHRVIGIDVRDAEVIADLSTPAGRVAMVDAVTRLSEGTLDGLVAAAGIANGPGELVASVNFFGAIATLEGLRPLLAQGAAPRAVALSSNSTSTQPGYPMDVVQACLAGDEARARALASADPSGVNIYPATKLALAHWVRRHAVTAEWIGAGVSLNAIAPGFIDTPMTAGMNDYIWGLGDLFPIPIMRAGAADEVAGLLMYLLGADAGFFCGSVIFMDGGTDAAVRTEDWPSPRA